MCNQLNAFCMTGQTTGSDNGVSFWPDEQWPQSPIKKANTYYYDRLVVPSPPDE